MSRIQGFGRAAAALLLLTLAACGAAPPTVQLANAVAMSREQGGRFIGLVGPRTQHEEPFLGVHNTNFSAMRSWNGASANGQALRFVPISVNEITCEQNCSYAEEFAAALSDPLLRASPQGVQVRFTAQSGASKLILVRGELVQKQLAAVDQARATLPTATAAVAPGFQSDSKTELPQGFRRQLR